MLKKSAAKVDIVFHTTKTFIQIFCYNAQNFFDLVERQTSGDVNFSTDSTDFFADYTDWNGLHPQITRI